MTSRLAVVTGDAVGASMAGPAIRSVELARALAAGLDAAVELVVPAPTDLRLDGVVVRVAAGDDELRAALTGADVVVVFAAVAAVHPWLADLDAMVVVDAYDPGLLETLERFRGAPRNESRTWVVAAHEHLVAALRFADAVVVASPAQRQLTIGLLAAIGRLGARLVAEDPALDRFVLEVPFGAPDEPARPTGAPALRAPGGPVDQSAVVALWGGGLYDWLDPLTLVEAVARCDDPRVSAVLLAGPHPTPAVGDLPLVERARRRAASLGLEGGRIVFVERWVPYQERVDWLLQADVGVSLHHHHLETEFAYRTRVLDYLWAGLPVLATEGDVLAAEVQARDLGTVVAPGDADAVAAALDAFAAESPQRRRARRARAERFVEEHRWSVVAAPLVEACREPRQAPDRRVGEAPLGAGAPPRGPRALAAGLRRVLGR